MQFHYSNPVVGAVGASKRTVSTIASPVSRGFMRGCRVGGISNDEEEEG